MITAGIDKLTMYTSQYALELRTLAKVREIDPDKFAIGLGQHKMSVPPPGEDIITLAANAAQKVLEEEDTNAIEMLLFATESGIDQSKASALFVHELLSLPAHCRCIELKQACYGATAGLQMALPYLKLNPGKKILLIAADVARYGLRTPGESSQGAGAVAMLLSASPRLLAIEPEFGIHTESVMDFWRPNYLHEALVDGKYSSKLYLTSLEKSWVQYTQKSKRDFKAHDYFCYHTPVPRLVEKAHQHLQKVNEVSLAAPSFLQDALYYSRQTGNSYTASLYINLLSLLEQTKNDLSGKRIGFYSYGSGSVAEFFSGIVQPGYTEVLNSAHHESILDQRTILTYEQYEAFYTYQYNYAGLEQVIPDFKTGQFKLTKLSSHKRIYTETTPFVLEKAPHVMSKKKHADADHSRVIRINAPGKLILAGEHAVVHGGDAIAMAIDRYVTATITDDPKKQLSFIFSNLAHQSRINLTHLHVLKEKIKNKYHRFISGDFSIREVLAKPFELAQFALGLLSETLDFSIPHGAKIQLDSNIPIGCGLGSSAATIISIMNAMAKYAHLSLSTEQMYKLALEAENMQHGQSSGFDLRVALQGGCLYIHKNVVERRPIPQLKLQLINTGVPETSTGECVKNVTPHFRSQALRDAFSEAVHKMDQALRNQSWGEMQKAIRENHHLLVKIGVVPEKVKQFIHSVEHLGGAAKVCGSGAVKGEQAGVVLIACEDNKRLSELCKRFGYQLENIVAESRGVHAAA